MICTGGPDRLRGKRAFRQDMVCAEGQAAHRKIRIDDALIQIRERIDDL